MLATTNAHPGGICAAAWEDIARHPDLDANERAAAETIAARLDEEELTRAGEDEACREAIRSRRRLPIQPAWGPRPFDACKVADSVVYRIDGMVFVLWPWTLTNHINFTVRKDVS